MSEPVRKTHPGAASNSGSYAARLPVMASRRPSEQALQLGHPLAQLADLLARLHHAICANDAAYTRAGESETGGAR